MVYKIQKTSALKCWCSFYKKWLPFPLKLRMYHDHVFPQEYCHVFNSTLVPMLSWPVARRGTFTAQLDWTQHTVLVLLTHGLTGAHRFPAVELLSASFKYDEHKEFVPLCSKVCIPGWCQVTERTHARLIGVSPSPSGLRTILQDHTKLLIGDWLQCGQTGH